MNLSPLIAVLGFTIATGATANAEHVCDKTDGGWKSFARRQAFISFAMAGIPSGSKTFANFQKSDDGDSILINYAAELSGEGKFYILDMDVSMVGQSADLCAYPMEVDGKFVEARPDWWLDNGSDPK